MAKIKMEGLDTMRALLEQRGAKVEGTVNHMLRAGAKVMREEMQAAMKEYELKDTGDMIKSVKSSKITRTKDGGKSISVAPQGLDRKGVPNAAKALVYEQGASNYPARPWFTLAVERGSEKALARMREVFDEEMSKAGGGAE